MSAHHLFGHDLQAEELGKGRAGFRDHCAVLDVQNEVLNKNAHRASVAPAHRLGENRECDAPQQNGRRQPHHLRYNGLLRL